MSDSAQTPSTTGAGLLVVDAQPVFLDSVHGAKALRARLLFSVQAAKLLGLPVFFTTQVGAKLGGVEELFLKHAPDSAPVFDKTAFSVLGAEGLSEALARAEVEHVLLAGVETPICVYQSALDLRDDGFAVTVLGDAVGCRRPTDGEAVLALLRTQAGLPVLPSESIFYSLLGSAGHPAFKEFTGLVKAAHEASA